MLRGLARIAFILWITVHTPSGHRQFVNVDHMVRVYTDTDGRPTIATADGKSFAVHEADNKIMAKIIERTKRERRKLP